MGHQFGRIYAISKIRFQRTPHVDAVEGAEENDRNKVPCRRPTPYPLSMAHLDNNLSPGAPQLNKNLDSLDETGPSLGSLDAPTGTDPLSLGNGVDTLTDSARSGMGASSDAPSRGSSSDANAVSSIIPANPAFPATEGTPPISGAAVKPGYDLTTSKTDGTMVGGPAKATPSETRKKSTGGRSYERKIKSTFDIRREEVLLSYVDRFRIAQQSPNKTQEMTKVCICEIHYYLDAQFYAQLLTELVTNVTYQFPHLIDPNIPKDAEPPVYGELLPFDPTKSYPVPRVTAEEEKVRSAKRAGLKTVSCHVWS